MVTHDFKIDTPNHETRSFDTAEELIRALAPIPTLDTQRVDSEFIFRGERNAEWLPTPRATSHPLLNFR